MPEAFYSGLWRPNSKKDEPDVINKNPIGHGGEQDAFKKRNESNLCASFFAANATLFFRHARWGFQLET